jgi:hypothetical protein
MQRDAIRCCTPTLWHTMTLLLESIPVGRRSFLASCSMLALGFTGCARLLDNAHLSYLAIDEPPPQAYLPVLQALVRTVLPFDHPRFPAVSPQAIDRRLAELFPFTQDDEDSLALRKALMIFDAVDLFPAAPAALLAQEADALGIDDQHSSGWTETVGTKRAADERIFAAFSEGSQAMRPAHFVELTPEARVRYYALWSQRAFSVTRHVYRASKALILVTAWSMDEMWSAIGYPGPLVGGP